MSVDIANVIVSRRLMQQELRSALPDAPVVQVRAPAPARTRRTRSALAGVLQRAADVVAPA